MKVNSGFPPFRSCRFPPIRLLNGHRNTFVVVQSLRLQPESQVVFFYDEQALFSAAR
jgi:hypothetical protein